MAFEIDPSQPELTFDLPEHFAYLRITAVIVHLDIVGVASLEQTITVDNVNSEMIVAPL
jgi:uncharacterized protein YfaS (alpha-2-macroglobulin family)